MATSYGSITITDKTDLGRLSVFIQGSTVNQQAYNGNTSVYYPNWDTSNSGTALLLTPYVYYDSSLVYNGTASNSQVSIAWSKIENGTDYGTLPKSPTTSSCPEALNSYGCLNRPINLTPGGTGAIYKATITYYPISTDHSVYLTALATFNINITQYGADGVPGNPGKALQLTGTGSHFTYTYNSELFGAETITLTAQLTNMGTNTVHWYCDNNLIYSGPSTTGSVPYTSLSLQVAGNGNITGIPNIASLSSNFTSQKYAQFKVVEIDSNGNEVSGGLIDYFNIYKYLEAAPGEGAYVSFLDNDEETIIEYDGIPQLGNAVSQLYVTHDGTDDMNNWHITVSDNINDTTSFNYIAWNTKDYPNGVLRGISTTIISNNGTQAPTIDGTSISISNLSANMLVIYNNNIYCWNGSKWVLNQTNYNKFGPDKVAVITMEATTAMITFTAVHGSYAANDSFIADGEVANLINTFSLARSASVISHSLRLDAVNSNKAALENVYIPATVEVDAVTRTGGSGANPYRDSGVIHAIVHLNNGSSTIPASLYNFGTAGSPIYYTSNTANNALLLTLANYGNISYIETFLGGTYNSSTYTFDGAEDKQKITISNDGTDGLDSWQVNLTNPFDPIATNYNGVAITTNTYDIPFEALLGAVQQTVRFGGTTYPTVSATCSNNNITLEYFNNNTKVTTAGQQVNRVKFTVTGGTTNVGSEGIITFTFNLDGVNTVTRIYSYKAYAEALDAVNVQIYGDPAPTFTNQSGTIYLIPIVTEGVNPISDTSIISKYTWYIFDTSGNTSAWKMITHTTPPASNKYYDSGIQTGYFNNNNNFQPVENGATNRQSKVLQIQGTSIEGYAYFKVEVSMTIEGNNTVYTGYIPVTDIDDPIQVTLHSTLGEQLVNSQGAGVVYVRVTRNNEELDPLPPDNEIGIGTTAPSNADNSSPYTGKKGFFVYNNNPTNPSNYSAFLRYFYRNSIGEAWQERTTSSCNYRWTFRNADNESIASTDSGLAKNIAYILANNVNTQFFFLNGSVVNKKLSADVKVTVD